MADGFVDRIRRLSRASDTNPAMPMASGTCVSAFVDEAHSSATVMNLPETTPSELRAISAVQSRDDRPDCSCIYAHGYVEWGVDVELPEGTHAR